MDRVFLTARWTSLAMLNYEVPPQILQPLLPRGVELDTCNGRTLVSVVGFLFEGTRVRGIPAFFHQSFEEVNLRFYVRRRRPEGWVRGVVFVKEIVPRFLVAAIARLVYRENYVAMPMRHEITYGAARYEWRSGGEWNSLHVRVQGEPSLPQPGSEEEFITEHYWGYAAQPDGSTIEYQVTHPQWQVWKASECEINAAIEPIYGKQFVPYLQGAPSSAFLAVGSAVSVMEGNRLG